ncbi:MAG: hypothetical protein WBV82_21270 [Myxococcaceae bacterium]
MKTIRVGLLTALALTTLACGGPDNVGACKRFLESTKCGSVDISETFNCEVYQNTTCDLSPYFDCAASHYVCQNGQYDQSKLSTFGTDCAAKATCG